MAIDERNQLWQAVWDGYYDACYQEIICDNIIQRWHVADEVAKVIIALTASGSAIAGWALWQHDGYRSAWAVFAGFGAVLAIVHSALAVSAKVTLWSDLKRDFVDINLEFDILKKKMEINPQFDVTSFTSEFIELKRRYSMATQKMPNDLLKTRKLEFAAQDELNEALNTK